MEQTISKLTAWAQLVRLPNVFTIIADVSAAFLMTAAGPEPLGRLALVVLGGISLYWAGMTLNDVFDEAVDRQQRARRPIPAGLITRQEASIGGWLLLGLGIGLCAASGYLPNPEGTTTSLPALIGILLAIMIVAYDGPLKKTHLAPAAMGSCRLLSFLLGAAPCLNRMSETTSEPFGIMIPKETLTIAIGFGVYIMGVTTMARREATGGNQVQLTVGAMITALGALCLAFAPQLARQPAQWKVDTSQVFPILIGMIAFPVIIRAIRAIRNPSPKRIQATIKAGIITIIPFSAAFALLGAGPGWGLGIFALVVPAFILSAKFRVT